MPAVSDAMTLTMWTTESFSPTQDITSGQILAQQVDLYEADHPQVRLETVLKEPYGKGGLLDFYVDGRSGRARPAAGPDNPGCRRVGDGRSDRADPAARRVDPQDLVADLFPFAREAATFDGQLYGLQFQAIWTTWFTVRAR